MTVTIRSSSDSQGACEGCQRLGKRRNTLQTIADVRRNEQLAFWCMPSRERAVLEVAEPHLSRPRGIYRRPQAQKVIADVGAPGFAHEAAGVTAVARLVLSGALVEAPLHAHLVGGEVIRECEPVVTRARRHRLRDGATGVVRRDAEPAVLEPLDRFQQRLASKVVEPLLLAW